MNVEQLRWLLQQVDHTERERLLQSYAEQLDTDGNQPVFLHLRDHVSLPRRLGELQCPIKPNPAFQLPLLPHQVSRAPAPANEKATRVNKDYPAHEPTSHPLPKGSEPKVPGGPNFELARIRTMQRRPEGRGISADACSWVTRAFEHIEAERRDEREAEAATFPDVLKLCNKGELAMLMTWADKNEPSTHHGIELLPNDLGAMDRSAISLPDQAVQCFLTMIDTYSKQRSAREHKPEVRSVKFLSTTFAQDPTGAALQSNITGSSLELHEAIVIPFHLLECWALVVVQPKMRHVYTIRANNAMVREELDSVLSWIRQSTGETRNWPAKIVESLESSDARASSVLVCYNAALYAYNAEGFKGRDTTDAELRAIRKWVLYNLMRGAVDKETLSRLMKTKR